MSSYPTDSEIKRDILRFLEALDNDGRKLSSGEQPPVTNGTQVVTALMVGCLRLSRGIQLLVHRDLPEEGHILARTLIEDSTLLAYLHKHSDRLEDFALTIIQEFLKEDQALEAHAESIGMLSPKLRLPRIQTDLARVRTMVTERGMKRPPPIPSLNDMLSELEAPEVYWSYKKASQMVHSTTALASRMDWSTQGIVGVNLEGKVNSALVVGNATTEAVMTGLIGGGLLMGWDVTPIVDVRDPVRAIYRKWFQVYGERTGAFRELDKLRKERVD